MKFNYQIIIEYLGVDLVGWQIQKKGKSVQGLVEKALSKTLNYKIGTMIELPRACLTADKIAPHADFFSFGTNDLTQTSFGFSRDDLGNFMHTYLNNDILDKDPFKSIDVDGVGELIKIATLKGRKVNKNLKRRAVTDT